MPRRPSTLEALSPGQLARRWGLGVDRVRQLVVSGHLPGAFKVPAAGRYGEALRVPLAAILKAEQDWSIVPVGIGMLPKRRGRRNGSPPMLKHFPELATRPEPDAESRGGDQY
jgi:hypothetical protein